jgi:hypothetical protein
MPIFIGLSTTILALFLIILSLYFVSHFVSHQSDLAKEFKTNSRPLCRAMLR